MSAQSRTTKSIKNSVVALGFYIVELILKFFSRKIFLDYLGTEILGLNTTASNLLQFLNLAELGIGSAIACTLYKPLFDNDTRTINEIISLQGWMYRKIAMFIIGGSLILMAFFPWIFNKMELPLWYAYASFGVLLFSNLLGYFVNYKQILLSADQKDYKIQYSYRAMLLIKTVCQIVAITTFSNGYLCWLILEIVFAALSSTALNRTIHKTYPYLKTDLSLGKNLQTDYPDIIIKIKQLFFHKFAGFALHQSSTIIIYAYASLTLVALYGNYMLIIIGVTGVMNAIFNSIGASVGNLIAEGNKARILAVYEELFSVRFWLSCIVCFGVYYLTPPFVTLWIGPEYVMDSGVLLIMVATLYIQLTRSINESYVFAYGLFSDIWAPIAEACINVGLSVLLGYYFGLEGILSGVLISLLVIVFCWKPYFLFKRGLKEPLWKYIWMYFKHILAASISLMTMISLKIILPSISSDGWLDLMSSGLVHVLCFATVSFASLCVLSGGIRNFIRRFLKR